MARSGKVTADHIATIRSLHNEGHNNSFIANVIGVTSPTVAYHLRKFGLRAFGTQHTPEFVSADEVRCLDCRETMPVGLFRSAGSNTYARCRPCRKLRERGELSRNIRKFLVATYRRSVAGSRSRGIEFSITMDEWMSQFRSQEGKCFYTDEPLSCAPGTPQDRNSLLSADRMDNSLGYVSGNVVFCTYKANACKNSASLREVSAWMPGWYQRIVAKTDAVAVPEMRRLA